MNHVKLHNEMSKVLQDLIDGKVKPQYAREIFNGSGKLINNCKNELVAISMGAKIEVPLLEITATESGQLKSMKKLNG